MQFIMGAFDVDVRSNRLTLAERTIVIEPRVMDVLQALAKQPGTVVSRDELIEQVWQGTHGADESLTRAISILRKTIRDAGEDTKYIETVYKRGYRITVPIEHAKENLGSTVTVKTEPSTVSLAVLTFADMSSDGDQGHFADGVAEEIINALTRVPSVQVSGRTSSFSFKGTEKPIRDIAQTLGVTHVIEGSLRKDGDQIRIAIQFIEASSERRVWSKSFDGSLTDLFELQERIARVVEGEVHEMIGGGDARRPGTLATPLTESTKAYECFIRGRALVQQLDGVDALPRAIKLLEQAVAFDPEFIEAWAFLARANFYSLEHVKTPEWRENIAAGRMALQQAMELDQNAALVQSTLGYQALLELKVDGRLNACKNAYELDRASPAFTYAYGTALASIGQSERGLNLMQQGIDREPLMANWVNGLANAKYALGDFTGAQDTYQRAFDLGFESSIFLKAGVLIHLGRSTEAIECVRQHTKRLGPVTHKFGLTHATESIGFAAFFKKRTWARGLLYLLAYVEVRNRNTQPTSTLPFRCEALGFPALFMEAVRRNPHPYLGSTLAQLWTPTVEAKRTRTHKDFPVFAEDIGLVRAWQAFGWPDTIKPVEGTDGSNGQFVCT